jgi:acetyl esterase/lipase
LVISLNYNKAPRAQFPESIHELEQLILAALEDKTLPIDFSRVAISGWSSGGALALAVSQLPSMWKSGSCRFQAVLPIYAVTYFTNTSEKVQSRRYKPDLGGFRGQQTDFMARQVPMLLWANVPTGQDLTDPLLSPIYADRQTLPKNVFAIGCELDFLARDGW